MDKKVLLNDTELEIVEKIFATAFTVGVGNRDRELLEARYVRKKLYGMILGYSTRNLADISDKDLFMELCQKIHEEKEKEDCA